ncbi:MAG: hypothetical protein CMH30_02965 [Micavibrio sp.]|nr:hypothetical protein [Micavibrio sp.]
MTESRDIIKELCDDLRPCKPLSHPLLRMGPWVVLSLIFMMIMAVKVIGLRPDWYEMLMYDRQFQIDIGLATFLGISSALTLGWVNLPDMRQQSWVMAIPAVALVLFLLNIIFNIATADYSQIYEVRMGSFSHCALIVGLPLVALVYLVRKGCPSCHKRSALFAIMTVTALGWVGLRFTCVVDNVAQNFIIQFLPFVLIGLILSVFSDKFFRW